MTHQLPGDLFERYALVSLEGEFSRRLRLAGNTVICPNRNFAEATVDNLSYLCRLFKEIQPDLIHLNGFDGFPILCVAQISAIPIIAHVRNNVLEPYREYLRAAEHVVVVSEFLRRRVLQLDVDPDRIDVIHDEIEIEPRPINRDTSHRERSKRLFGVSESVKVVSMVARMVPYKRHDLLLRAAALLRASIPGFRLILVGEANEDPLYARGILSMVSDLKLSDVVIWVPFVANIADLHSISDVAVLCSDGEGLGRCIVEASAMGIPVVVTNSGGTQEVVKHNVSGLIVDSGDHVALARAINSLLSDASLWTACSLGGRRFAEAYLAADRSAKRVEAIYSRILANNQGAFVGRDDNGGV